ncbi:TPA: hypothetical protein SLE68_001558 [Morganella morganii]|nr:hypothetical protein [Morganella morganii]HDU8495622.1 hypothetical protein [Morganella morganii]HDU8548712.1 hypothetical protein [Morganella morganii]HEI8461835.1 hypothetical protein [Morganella morganii]
MDNYKYIDRFFDSSFELMDIRYKEQRNSRTLYSFLNSLHSLNDRLKKDFDVSLLKYPEFMLLKHLRNYYHHEGDINEIRVFFNHKNIMLSHSEMIIIPICTVAKALRLFLSGKMIKWKAEEKENLINYCHDLTYVFDNLDGFANDPKLPHHGKFYSGGFDLYVSIYNITNIVASLCREISEISRKVIVKELDETYDINNNIDKKNLIVPLGVKPVLTTEGFIFL